MVSALRAMRPASVAVYRFVERGEFVRFVSQWGGGESHSSLRECDGAVIRGCFYAKAASIVVRLAEKFLPGLSV